jgi:hypothetical protein
LGPVPSWSEAEARAYLPRLRQLLAVIRRSTHLAAVARANGHAPAFLSSPPPGEEQWEIPPGFDVAAAARELEEGGIVVRDPVGGLVDFPSRAASGKEVHLCWRADEDDLGWWHFPEDGFAGRQPLPVPPGL